MPSSSGPICCGWNGRTRWWNGDSDPLRHGLRKPLDALQAASCLQLGSEHVMPTGDEAFERVHGLNVKVLA